MTTNANVTEAPPMADGMKDLVDLGKTVWRMGKRAWQLREMQDYWIREERRVRETGLGALVREQDARLRHMVRFAYGAIPHYREAFDRAGVKPGDISSVSDLPKLPILHKEDVRRGFPDRMVEVGRRFPPYMIGKTSGSTSNSLCFVRPDERFRRSLYYAVLLRTAGRTDAPVFVFSTPTCTPTCRLRFQHDRPTPATRLAASGRFRHLKGMRGLPAFFGNILTAPDSYFEDLCDRIGDTESAVLVADPVYLGAFGRYLRTRAQRIPRLSSIITTYELLTPSLRTLIESTFDCRITVQYGASEINDIANECEHGRLHVRMDQVIVEVVANGRPVAPGGLGRILVTDLWNTNMPFLRYDIGDVGSWAEGECPCGRRSLSLQAVHGRAADLIYLEGRWIAPLEADEVFGACPSLVAYQITQTEADAVSIALQVEPGHEVAFRSFESSAARVLGKSTRIQWRVVSAIPPRPSNKFQFVRSQLSQPVLQALES